jgi:hypothetical protein
VSRSDDVGEFGERGRDATAWVGLDAEFVVPAAHVLHERVTAHDYPRAAIAFEAAHRTQPRFESTMVGLDPIVRVPLGIVKRAREELINDSALT